MSEKKEQTISRLDIDELVRKEKEKNDVVWIEGEVSSAGDKIQIRPLALANQSILMEFSKEDVLSQKSTKEGNEGISVKAGSVYITHIVSTLRSIPGSFGATANFVPQIGNIPTPKLLGANLQDLQKFQGQKIVDLGDWVLSQKSHGHVVFSAGSPAEEASQKSHGHMVFSAVPYEEETSQKSHGHMVFSAAPQEEEVSQKSHGHSV